MKFFDELQETKIQNSKKIVKSENNKILYAENANTESNYLPSEANIVNIMKEAI